ncbi:baseplate protein, partial [Salmonella enterica]|nr:baseplate protein [Salmonella enterica]
TVKGHGRSNGKVGDTVDARTIASQKGTATDSAITRYRPMIILADSKIDAQSATARALREQRRRLAKSVTFEAQLDGWTRSNGQIWMPNILAEIDASKFAIQTGPLLVSKVVLTLDDREGVKTTLTLAPRDGFLVPVEKDRKGKSSGSNASAGGIDALAEEYYRNHPEKRP